MATLIDLTAVSHDAMAAELAQLRAENAALKANQKPVRNGMKVGEKGGLSLYGYGRFPITLYKTAWLDILDRADEIKAFIKANDHLLKAKGE